MRFRYVSLTLAIIISFAVKSQCPPNIDFEAGNFSSWTCKTGIATENGINWTGLGEEVGRHTIIPPTDNSKDRFGGFPKHCPNGSGYSVQLGDEQTGKNAEGLVYTFTIPASATKFALVFYYAIVLQDPGHSVTQQPHFTARITDSYGSPINCVAFDFSASSSLPGFESKNGAVYRDWTPITINLSGFAGQTLSLEFATADCTLGGHFGYAYIDVNSDCSGFLSGSSFCNGDTQPVTLEGPYGFQNYQWFSNPSFTNQIATTQNIQITPSYIGSTIPLIVTPYPGFGCVDTFYSVIATGVSPPRLAGSDRVACSNQSVQLGSPENPDYSYSWTPVSYVSNSQAADPLTIPGFTVPTKFYLKTTDKNTRCYSHDSVVVTPYIVDTSILLNGKTSYCPGESIQLSLTASSLAGNVQWYKNDLAITGANQFIYRPQTPGKYWAVINQSTCTDSSSIYEVAYTIKPKVGFNVSAPIQCTKYPIIFTNTTSQGNSASYKWQFSDGTISTNIDEKKIFSSIGAATIKLVASLNGCSDSLEQKVNIVQECGPFVPTAFSPNGDRKNDDFKPLSTGIKKLKRFTVFDRFGYKVFSTTKLDDGWDGTIKSVAAASGTYVWLLEFVDFNDLDSVLKGTVVLIR